MSTSKSWAQIASWLGHGPIIKWAQNSFLTYYVFKSESLTYFQISLLRARLESKNKRGPLLSKSDFSFSPLIDDSILNAIKQMWYQKKKKKKDNDEGR